MFKLFKNPNNTALNSSIVWIFCIEKEDESIASEIHSAFLRAAGEPPRANNALRGLT
jgi:hypothetical protein